MLNLGKVFERDDKVWLNVKQGPKGKWRWYAYSGEYPGTFRCQGPILGFNTEAEAYKDAYSLLNIEGER